MAQVGDLSVLISAETKRATEALRQVELVASKSTRDQKLTVTADTQQAVVNLGKLAVQSKELNKSLLSTNSVLKNTASGFDLGKVAGEFVYLNKRVEGLKQSVGELRETLKLLGASQIVDIADSIAVTLLARFNPELFQDQIQQAVVQGVQQGTDRAKGILYRNFFEQIVGGINDGINQLARIGFAGQGLMFIVQPIKAAFQGLFDFTIGQNIQLKDTILATATTLATTADVLDANGKKIVDPFERITALQRPVENAIDSIRERSLKLAGVTSSQVVDVFSVVATNIGQINGNLKDAEDLAIAFTASLGTLGIPLFQARQEIGSILGGYITEDSLLARRLGITNDQVRDAKQKAGGVTKFLLDKLSTAEAGQAILAEGFRGVTSNIAELFELVGLSIGKPLLDPLVKGLNLAFQALFNFKQLLMEVGQLVSGTITSAFEIAFEPLLNSDYIQGLKSGFERVVQPLKELMRVSQGDKKSFLEQAILGMNPDRVPQVLDGFISQVRSLRNEVKEAGAEAADPLKRLLAGDREDTGLTNLQPQRIASLPLLDTQAFNKGWDTVRSTLEEVTKAFGALALAFAKFKIREIADSIRIFADVVAVLGNAFLGAANFVASFAGVVTQLLQMPLIEYFNQLRLVTQFTGASDFVDNLKILTTVGLGLRGVMISSVAAFNNYKTGLQGIALASKAASGTLSVTSASLQGLSLSGRIFAVGGDLTARVLDKLGGALGYTQSEINRVKKEFGSMDSVMKAARSTMSSVVGQMIALNLAFVALNIVIGAAIVAFSNYMEAQRKAKRDAENLRYALQLSTKEMVELARSTDKADLSKFARQMRKLDTEIEKAGEGIEESTKYVNDLADSIERMEKLGFNPSLLKDIEKFEEGGFNVPEEIRIRRELSRLPVINPMASLARYKRLLNDKEAADKALADKQANEKQLLDKKAAIERQAELENEAELMGKRREDLERDIAKFRTQLNRELANKEFSMRMENDRKLAQAELQLAQVRINEARRRGEALLEGEEGASAAAKRALVAYIAQRDSAAAELQHDEAEFQIQMAEASRDLENYKLGIQEKITEMHKKVGEYQKRIADYLERKAKNEADLRADGARRAAEQSQTGNVAGVTGLREGTTGSSTANHFHVEGVGFTPSEAGARALFDNAVRDQLSTTSAPGPRVHPVTGGIKYHAGWDLAGPNGSGQGLPFNLASGYKMTEFVRNNGGAGNMAVVEGPDGLKYRVMHLADPGPNYKMPTGAAQTPATPVENVEAPEFPDLSLGGDTSGLDAQLGRLQALESRLKSLRQMVRDADTQEAFDAIAKSLFKLPNVKSIEDQNNVLKNQLALIDEIEDPKRRQIQAQYAQQKLESENEYSSVLEDVIEKLGEGSQEVAEFERQSAERKDKFIKRLKEQRRLQKENLELAKQLSIVESIKDRVRSTQLGTSQQVATDSAGMFASTEFSAFDRRRFEAAGRIESFRLEKVNENGGLPLIGKALEDFNAFAEKELVNADRLAELDGLKERFQQLGQVAAGVGDTIGDAFTNGFADILTGTQSVEEVLNNTFENIGQSFMRLAQQIIADMIKMLIFKSLLSIFGGGDSFFGGSGFGKSAQMPTGTSIGAGGGSMMNGLGQVFGTLGPNFGFRQFAKGGIVNGPTPALIGEGGMNEAVVPLPNGKAIPVDFGGKKAGGDVNTTINVSIDQGGNAQTEMSGEDASRLGKAIDGAVKRVIMEERRAGGLLYNGRR